MRYLCCPGRWSDLLMTLLVTSLMLMTSARPSPSHLSFYLAVDKQLLPQLTELADRVRGLLQTQCGQLYDNLHDCLTDAESFPPIPALDGFPSKGTLQREGNKAFTKHVLKDAHNALYKLQVLLAAEDQGYPPLKHLIADMDATRRRLREQLEDFYQVRLRDSPGKLGLSRRRYVTCLLSDTAPRAVPRVSLPPGGCLSLSNYRLRLLFTAHDQIRRAANLVEYVVKLSWVELGDRHQRS